MADSMGTRYTSSFLLQADAYHDTARMKKKHKSMIFFLLHPQAALNYTLD